MLTKFFVIFLEKLIFNNKICFFKKSRNTKLRLFSKKKIETNIKIIYLSISPEFYAIYSKSSILYESFL